MRSRRRPGKRLPAACVAFLAVAPLPSYAVRISYQADMGVERNDNVLMSSSDEMGATALRAGFGVLVTENTSTVQANVGGRLDYWNYVEGPQTNALETSLAGRLNWQILPETVSFTVEDSLEMRPIDRFEPNTSENLQRVNVLSLGPNVHFDWRALQGRFEMRWIDTSAEVTDEYESERLSAALHLLRELDSTSSLTLSVRAQEVDFDHNLIARDYRRYDSYLRYQKELNRVGFGLDAGYSWIDYDDGSSASHPLVRGEIHWQARERSFLSMSLTHQLSDTADDAIAAIGEAVTVPDDLSGSSGAAMQSSIYEDNRADVSYSYRGERVSVSVGPYYQRIDYLDDSTMFDETRRGALAQFSYDLSETWNLATFVDVARASFTEVDRRTTDTRVGVGVDKTHSRHWSSALQFTHYRRDDDGVFGNARQNILYLTVTYRNR